MKSGLTRALPAAVALLWNGPSAAAHDGLHEQIVALTREIEAHATEPELYVRRGELQRLHRQYDLALADFARARALDPCRAPSLSEARLYADLGWSERAQAALENHLAARPDDAEALLLRARLREECGALEEAVRDYDRALAGLEPPEPDPYLARANALAVLGPAGVDRALSGLDEALARLGPVSSLELRAIELEVERARFDAALVRLEQLASRSPRQERWLAQRGEILLRAGRAEEALSTFRAARCALELLPARQHGSTLVLELERTVALRLAELESNTVAATEQR